MRPDDHVVSPQQNRSKTADDEPLAAQLRRLRPRARSGPSGDDRRGWHGRHECASAGGNRGSSPDGGCSVGRSACSRFSLHNIRVLAGASHAQAATQSKFTRAGRSGKFTQAGTRSKERHTRGQRYGLDPYEVKPGTGSETQTNHRRLPLTVCWRDTPWQLDRIGSFGLVGIVGTWGTLLGCRLVPIRCRPE
jgi:hypothetical protein